MEELENEEDFFIFRMYYYKILNKFSKKNTLYAGDFRLVDREIIRNFNLNNEDYY